MKIVFLSVFYLFVGLTNVSEQELTEIFNNSDLVIKAKVSDVRAVSNVGVVCNLEVEKIYKGKRIKAVLLELKDENEMELYKSYLLYLEKPKSKKSSFFIKKRRVIEDSQYFQNEINFLVDIVKGKKFKKVKNPTPKHEIRFDCGCD